MKHFPLYSFVFILTLPLFVFQSHSESLEDRSARVRVLCVYGRSLDLLHLSNAKGVERSVPLPVQRIR